LCVFDGSSGFVLQRSAPGTVTILLIWASALAGVPADIRALTGARTRIAWCRDAGDGSDPFGNGESLRLVGIDTDDGRGERVILGQPAGYAKPLITPKGDRIVFTNRRTHKVFVVNWDGTGLRPLDNGWAADVWADPGTGVEWVYVRRGLDKNSPIVRVMLDKPQIEEPVWSKTPVDVDSFQLSADGTRAAGMFPWSGCGVAELPNKSWKQYGSGCWTSLSPDNSCRFWHFDGAHRNLYLFDYGARNQRVVNISKVPGIDDAEVYHPRWSSDVRFLTITGPYRHGIPGGGKAVELFIGRFNAKFDAVESWVRVTRNQQGDFFGDAWMEPGNEPADQPPVQDDPPPATEPPKMVDRWPCRTDGLLFLWENSRTENMIPGEAERRCTVEARGRAKLTRHYAMDLAGGAFVAEGADGVLIEQCRASNCLVIEALITPDTVEQAGPARIISFSSDATKKARMKNRRTIIPRYLPLLCDL